MDFAATHRLGFRAFTLFFLRRVRWVSVAIAALAAGWFFREKFAGEYILYVGYGLEVALLVAAGIFFFQGLRAYFEYRGYAYRFDQEFFHLTRGYLTRQEIGVVYHQIQTVILRRGVMDRATGVTHLVIVMNGHNQYQPAEVLLPALDVTKARLVQRELLRQARMNSPRAGAAEEAREG